MIRESEYKVRDETGRVHAKFKGTGEVPYWSSIDHARNLSKENPGLTFEVAEDKIWFSAYTPISEVA